MNKTLLPCLLFAFAAFAAFGQKISRTYELRNGNWYNGKDFTPGAWYVVNGLLSKKVPAQIDSVVDLQERFVTPPIGDAFCASVADNSSAANVTKLYTEDGTFYLQIL